MKNSFLSSYDYDAVMINDIGKTKEERMKLESISRVLLSEPAILAYEAVIIIVLITAIVLVSRQRKQRKYIVMAAGEQRKRKSLDDTLANQRRR